MLAKLQERSCKIDQRSDQKVTRKCSKDKQEMIKECSKDKQEVNEK
jgi:hypothetical protein